MRGVPEPRGTTVCLSCCFRLPVSEAGLLCSVGRGWRGSRVEAGESGEERVVVILGGPVGCP